MASIYCDGACPGNGTARAFAGWAWAYWPGPARGEPKYSAAAKLGQGESRPTNQRAELMALLESMRFATKRSDIGSVTIYTDSMYAINCASKWGPTWKKKMWRRDSGEALLNLDIIKPLVELWARRKIPLQHVRGHQSGSGPEVHGNNWVDHAAVEAAHGRPIYLQETTVVSAPLISIPEELIELVEDDVVIPAIINKKADVKKLVKGSTKSADIRSWFSY